MNSVDESTVFIRPPELDPPFVVSWGIAVLLQWYLVGLWVDRRLGSAMVSAGRPTVFLKMVTWLALVTAGAFTILASYGTVTSDSGSQLRSFGFSLTIWFSFSLVVLATKIRRWRRSAHRN
jgi:hypothetical protein